MFIVLSSWQSHCESSLGSFNECRTATSGRWPKTKPDDLGCESASTRCQSLHPPSPFIIITLPESWYSFTVPRRVEGWVDLVGGLYRDCLPVHRRSPISVLTGSDVAQLRWSRPTRYHWAKPPTWYKTYAGAKNAGPDNYPGPDKDGPNYWNIIFKISSCIDARLPRRLAFVLWCRQTFSFPTSV